MSVAQNVIFLTCEDFEDKPVLGLVPSDVSLSITATAGDDTPIGHATSITPTGPGEFRVTYVVTLESQPSLFLSVFVCGVCLTPQPWQPVFAYTGGSRLIRSIPITAPVKYGIAVNKDENIMITSSHSQHCLTVTSLPSGATLRTIGSRGIRPGQLFEPFKLSFGPTQDTVLVCEPSNDRVSEFNVSSGEHVRCLPCTGAQTIACSGTGESDGMIVIGKDPGGASGDCISVYWYGSGCLLRTFGPLGSSPGSIATRCEGIRISPDGKHVYACEDGIKRISMFTIKVRHPRWCSSFGTFLSSLCPLLSRTEMLIALRILDRACTSSSRCLTMFCLCAGRVCSSHWCWYGGFQPSRPRLYVQRRSDRRLCGSRQRLRV